MSNEEFIFSLYEKIKTRSDFEFFLKELIKNLQQEDWDNNTLPLYLEGLYGYNFDSENDPPSWKLFAEILLAARVYE